MTFANIRYLHPRLVTRACLFLVLATMSLLCTGTTVYAQRGDDPRSGNYRKTTPKVLAAFHDVIAKPSQSTVRVLCDGKAVALGTIVDSDGWILTKASELKDNITCKLKDGRELDARLVGVSEQQDLAMLKVDAKNLKAAKLQDSRSTPVGNWVACPGIGEEPIGVGVVSVATRNVSTRGAPPPAPGGGGFLGISLDLNAQGAKVEQVTPGSPADKAGIKADDRILSVSGKKVEDGEALIALLQSMKAGDAVTVRVERKDEELDLKATLGKRPASSNRGDTQNRMGSELSERRTGFPTILQHDTVLKPSDCGGPLVDLDGTVIGINIARAGRTESYAVPSEVILPLLKDLKSGKLAPRATKESSSSRKPAADEKK